jgi:hypothetical protein
MKYDWLPTWLKHGEVENIKFYNGIPAVEFVNELLDWVNNSKIGDVRKKKYTHFITYYAVAALTREVSHLKMAYKELISYINWLSKKLRKSLPENARNQVIAYSL